MIRNPSLPITLRFLHCRSFSVTKVIFQSDDESKRIESWFQSAIKPSHFYEKQANPGDDGKRCYFYNIDLQGRLFLEENMPKSVASSIKDPKFLDFFFKRLQPAGTMDIALMQRRGIPASDYPFVSLCGKELNFIRPAATPIVFHTKMDSDASSSLVYAGSLTQEFRPEHLAVSCITGQVYHKITQHRRVVSFGLIKSSLAIELSNSIAVEGDSLLFHDEKKDSTFHVQSLPIESEPGSYALTIKGTG